MRHHRNTKGASFVAGQAERGQSVQLRSICCGACAALTSVLVLAGCASTDVFDSNEQWFSKPFSVVSRNGGYTYSELQEAKVNRPITASDLIDANGACPPLPPPAAPPAADASGAAVPASEAPSLLGGGIALGMSECDVVYRAGAPSAVQLGQTPGGDRALVLTYNSGPRPGIYRFERGHLVDMDRVAAAAPVPAPQTKVAKKKKKPPANPQRVSTE